MVESWIKLVTKLANVLASTIWSVSFLLLKDQIKQDLAKQILCMIWMDEFKDFVNFGDKSGKGGMVINDR